MVAGFLMLVLLAIAASRYLFLILEKTALGHQQPPLLSIDHFGLVGGRRALLVLAWLLIVASSRLTGGHALTVATILASALLAPAVLVLLAVSGETTSSIHPVRLLQFIRRMGVRYLAMAGATLLMTAGLLIGLAGWPPIAAEIAGLYLLVVAFHLLGRLAYLHRGRLQFRPERSPEIEQERRDAETDRSIQAVLDRIRPLSAVHEYRQALAALEAAIEELGAEEELAEAFTERVLQWDNPEVGLLYLQRRITAALRAGRTDAAWRLCQRGFAVTNRFHPATGDEAVLLTRHGFECGAHRKAMHLVAEFEERYPQLPELLPAAAVLEAKVLSEKLGRPEAALGRLNQLCRKHASCERSGELVAYLEVLRQGRKATPPPPRRLR